MSLSAEERLIPIRVKVKRAKKHFAELKSALNPYRDTYATVIGTEQDPQTGKPVQGFYKLPIIHFDILAIAGDVLQNLRSSLDHLVYQLALAHDHAASERTLHKVAFPIGESLKDYESVRGRKVGGLIHPTAIEFIDSYKPYKGGNDVLWRLHEANNLDKHRSLICVGKDILCDGDGFEGHYWLKGHNPSFTAIHTADGQEETDLTVLESVSKSKIVESDALIPSLHQTIEFVEGMIEDFRRFLGTS